MSGPPSPTAGVGSCSSATTLSLTGAPSPVRPAYSFGPQTGVTRSSASGGARPPFVTTDTCLVLGPELTGEPCESHNAGWRGCRVAALHSPSEASTTSSAGWSPAVPASWWLTPLDGDCERPDPTQPR